MSECILGTPDPYSNGYAKVCHNGKTHLAHRWEWEQANGAIPEGKVLMHACDNRTCRNLEHLSLGDAFENQQDSLRKGRTANLKLSAEAVRAIRLLLDQGVRQREIARSFGVSQPRISAIKRGTAHRTIGHIK